LIQPQVDNTAGRGSVLEEKLEVFTATVTRGDTAIAVTLLRVLTLSVILLII